MAIRDLLLPLIGDATRTTMDAIEKSVAMAARLDARITALALETEQDALPPTVADVLGETQLVQTAPTARTLLTAFQAAATKCGVRNEQRLERSTIAGMIGAVAEEARLKDLSVVPIRSNDSFSEKLVERLLFETGRPILMCPETTADTLSATFDDIAIAWDHTAPAARAVGDAIPLLKRATRVRIVTATDRASDAQRGSSAALRRHLAEHGIEAQLDVLEIKGSSVGRVFATYVDQNVIDLLVMGGYRHSPVNEWFWGGMTNTIINDPPCWVMLAH
ncbi:universal stress protein [Bradyrhizobium lablabi]|uniref:universal stress protein n=1 Tax=Bradyrhizobium lablabi TaxID=722472 RepID=UPI001BAC2312|nr:universal stress protein [Bradyrhizobium lablabi]MBR1125176.1 universal stress protein [Bradyrhizobium lablabi]